MCAYRDLAKPKETKQKPGRDEGACEPGSVNECKGRSPFISSVFFLISYKPASRQGRLSPVLSFSSLDDASGQISALGTPPGTEHHGEASHSPPHPWVGTP